MLDTKYLRDNIADLAQRLDIKGFTLNVDKINELESQRKVMQEKTQDLQSQRNTLSKMIGQLKSKGEDTADVLTQVGKIGTQLKKIEVAFDSISNELKLIQLEIPNIPDDSVPAGKTEVDNVEVKTWGDKPLMDFEPKDHVDLGGDQMDFSTAAKLAGSRFVVLHDTIALLHRALAQFMLDVHTTEHEYKEVYVPYLVNTESLYGTGQLPKFKEDLFTIDGESDLSLISTAEISVTNIVRDTIVEDNDMPINYVCHSPCFRSEAGSYGRDTRGMIRQHQFDKVEMVKIVRPQDSEAEHEKLLGHAEAILQKLGLAYRVVNLCGGDLGFSAKKTYDIEVWLPSQGTYREISSCSNFGDFQARRMKARWRNPETGKPEYLHTLNGSGLAVGRTLVAILENYQDAEGKIHIPEVLQPYMRGTAVI